MTEEAGAYAVGMDIDAAGLVTLALHGKPFGPKTLENIKEIVQSTKLPFILKGMMTPDEAELANALAPKDMFPKCHSSK